MPQDSPPNLWEVLFSLLVRGPFTSNLCRGLWSKLYLDPHVPGNELRDALGNVVRRCVSSLLGSYVHQELI